MAFKAQLRRKGIRVVSITEQAEDNATGRLLEGIIESGGRILQRKSWARSCTRGMREAASRGFFLGSKAPFRLHPRQGQRWGEGASHPGGGPGEPRP